MTNGFRRQNKIKKFVYIKFQTQIIGDRPRGLQNEKNNTQNRRQTKQKKPKEQE